MKNILHHAIALLQMKLIVVGDDSRRILPSVLQNDESIVKVLDYILIARNSNYSTHRRKDGKWLKQTQRISRRAKNWRGMALPTGRFYGFQIGKQAQALLKNENQFIAHEYQDKYNNTVFEDMKKRLERGICSSSL